MMSCRTKLRIGLHRPENDILFLFLSKIISCIHKVRIATPKMGAEQSEGAVKRYRY